MAPNRSKPRVTAAALVALALGATGCSRQTAPARPQGQPNLLIIAVDTLRADHLGLYGYEKPTSPAIDAFFESAVVFDDAHSVSSWTLPTFASLMTSLATSTHRCWGYRSRLDSSFTTLAEILGNAGYHTAGVVSHSFLGKAYGLAQGFAEYDEELVIVASESHQALSSKPVTEKGLAFLDRQAKHGGKQPWLLWLHYFDPHWLYRMHPGISSKFEGVRKDRWDLYRSMYDGEIAYTDMHIAQVLERLDTLGLTDNTVVVFVSDHGEEFNEHGKARHGKTLYYEVERIPFAIRAPGFAARRVADAVSVVDFLPTVLDLLDVPGPEVPMAGRSLIGVMRGREEAARPLLLELRLGLHPVDVEAYIDGKWKLIVEMPRAAGEPDRVMLFDRERDPLEMEDLAAEHPEIVQEMVQSMRQEIADARAVSELFKESAELQLSPEQIERLRALGYIGDGK